MKPEGLEGDRITANSQSEYDYFDTDRDCWVYIIRRGDGYEERWERGIGDYQMVYRTLLDDLPIQPNLIYKDQS